MNYIITALMVVAILSIVLNIVMVWYAKSTLLKIDAVYTASEEAVGIFSRMDSFKEHLQSVYDMPTFYGDETLQSLLEHCGQMIEFLKRYETIYSFTQPDLEKQLAEVSAEMDEHEDDEAEE